LYVFVFLHRVPVDSKNIELVQYVGK
jgi:hypothetical protein